MTTVWQPIETAPVDGRQILMWFPTVAKEGAAYVCLFLMRFPSRFLPEPQEGEGNWVTCPGLELIEKWPHKPTLWCPIPERDTL